MDCRRYLCAACLVMAVLGSFGRAAAEPKAGESPGLPYRGIYAEPAGERGSASSAKARTLLARAEAGATVSEQPGADRTLSSETEDAEAKRRADRRKRRNATLLIAGVAVVALVVYILSPAGWEPA